MLLPDTALLQAVHQASDHIRTGTSCFERSVNAAMLKLSGPTGPVVFRERTYLESMIWAPDPVRTSLPLTHITRNWSLVVSAALAVSGILFLIGPESHAIRIECNRLTIDIALKSRPFEGRWVGLRHTRFAGSAKAALLNRRLLRIARASIAKMKSDPAPTVLNLRGLLALVAQDYDAAAEALASDPRDVRAKAEALSNLSAIYSARARERNEPRFFFDALSTALTAVKESPSLLEARFNLALALEHLTLRREAVRAWNTYLGYDSESLWAAEAREHLQRLAHEEFVDQGEQITEFLANADSGDEARVQQIARDFPQISREVACEELLSAWARENRAGHAQAAARYLHTARIIGRELSQSSSDDMVLASVARIEKAKDDSYDQNILAVLGVGHIRFQEGQRAYRQFDIRSAMRAFTEASEKLSLGRSPLRLWALAGLAGCLYRGGRYADAQALLASISAEYGLDRYSSLAGRCAWLQGLMSFITGKWVASLTQYRQALASFTLARETGNIASINFLISENLGFLGVSGESNEKLIHALQGAGEIREPDRIQLIYQGTALAERRRGSQETAILFQNEAVRQARRLNVPEILAEALAARADIYARARNLPKALTDIEAAEAQVSHFSSDELRPQVEADISVKRWSIQRVLRPSVAVDELTEALTAHISENYYYYLSDLHFERAQALQALGREPEAEVDLRASFRILAQRAPKPGQPDLQGSFANRWATLSATLVSLQLARQDMSAAFESTEAARSWEPSLGLQEQASAMSPSIRASQIPLKVALLEYAILEDRLAIWLIRPSSVLFHIQPIDPQKLAAWSSALRDETRLDPGGQRSLGAAKALYALLITPFEAEIRGFDLVVVPDGVLLSLPFPGLVSPSTGRYLVEDHTVTVSPSTALYVGAVKRLQVETPLSQARFLAVGNPSRSRSLNLPTLENAESEARHIAALFPGSGILVGRDATRERFTADLSHYDALHFGAHALASPQSPSLSSLVLAEDPKRGDPGLLFLPQISELPFQRMKLVVLAACDTGAPSIEAAGPSAFVRVLMTQGVPSVIASLWRVPDESTETFFREFYRRLRAGESPAHALGNAQVEQLRRGSGANPTWQAFEIFQGSL
jgi:CHAT domain-containing protein